MSSLNIVTKPNTKINKHYSGDYVYNGMCCILSLINKGTYNVDFNDEMTTYKDDMYPSTTYRRETLWTYGARNFS
jgi:hypothetical protein